MRFKKLLWQVELVSKELNHLAVILQVFKKSKIAQVYYYDSQSAGINKQSPESDSTPRRLTLGSTLHFLTSWLNDIFFFFFKNSSKKGTLHYSDKLYYKSGPISYQYLVLGTHEIFCCSNEFCIL